MQGHGHVDPLTPRGQIRCPCHDAFFKSFAARLSTSFIRACHPGPVARNAANASGSTRSVIETSEPTAASGSRRDRASYWAGGKISLAGRSRASR